MNSESNPIAFTEAGRKRIERLIQRYPDKRSAILPVLYVAQEEFGFISVEVMDLVAQQLDLTTPKVFEVVTFYTLLKQRPTGKHVIQLCRTLSCALAGSEDILAHLKRRLSIGPGETTKDGLFTLQTVECLASCGTAPALQVNGVFFENLTREKTDRIIDDLKRGMDPKMKPMGEN